jgi:hypothetical protein
LPRPLRAARNVHRLFAGLRGWFRAFRGNPGTVYLIKSSINQELLTGILSPDIPRAGKEICSF